MYSLILILKNVNNINISSKSINYISLQSQTFYMEIGGHDSRIYSSQQPLIPCPNCNRRFPTNNIQIHEAYCSRNFRKCDICRVMIDKNSIDQHHKDAHSLKTCQFCGKESMGKEFDMHLQVCIAKPEPCPYCSKPCPKGQLKNHQQTCGARTKQCQICKKMITTKQFAGHQQRCQNRRVRRQNSQQQRFQPTQVQNQRLLIRQNSQNQLNLGPKRKQSVNSRQNEQKKQLGSKKNVIQRQQIKPQVSPIPISIQISLQNKNNGGVQSKNSLQSNNNLGTGGNINLK